MSTSQTDDLKTLQRLWQACNYLSAGMIYLRDNPLLSEPLKPTMTRPRHKNRINAVSSDQPAHMQINKGQARA